MYLIEMKIYLFKLEKNPYNVCTYLINFKLRYLTRIKRYVIYFIRFLINVIRYHEIELILKLPDKPYGTLQT